MSRFLMAELVIQEKFNLTLTCKTLISLEYDSISDIFEV